VSVALWGVTLPFRLSLLGGLIGSCSRARPVSFVRTGYSTYLTISARARALITTASRSSMTSSAYRSP
jgi:hypothetical protein